MTSDSLNCMIFDPVGSMGTNTLIYYMTTNEFLKFVNHTNEVITKHIPPAIISELDLLKNQVNCRPSLFHNDKYTEKYIGGVEGWIPSLEYQIKFERRLLEEQQ